MDSFSFETSDRTVIKPVLWTRPIRGQQRVLQSSAHALLTPRTRFPTTLRSMASSALHIDAILSLSFLSLLDWTLINYFWANRWAIKLASAMPRRIRRSKGGAMRTGGEAVGLEASLVGYRE